MNVLDFSLEDIFLFSEIMNEAIAETTDIGIINGWNIRRNLHNDEIRSGEIKPRAFGMSIDEMLELIKKFLKKVPTPQHNPYHLTYKLPNGKWNDMLVFASPRDKDIRIKTTIQDKRLKPTDYYTRGNDIQIIIEGVVHYFIILDEDI